VTSTLRTSIAAAAILTLSPLTSAQVVREGLVRPQIQRAPARSGAVIYVTVDGTKQGRFKGQSPLARWQSAIPAVAFGYEVGAPRDAARGVSSGRRMHSPVVISMPVGAAAPQFFAAATTDELLKSVLIQFVRTNATGTEEVFYTITLTGASIARYRQYLDAPDPDSPAGSGLIAEVSLTFQRIEMASADGGTMAMDVWDK
jgi:type VI secretion system secreted protein Hcp